MPDLPGAINAQAGESAYSAAAYALIERGLPAIPAMAGGKVPGVYERGRWLPMRGWTGYTDRLPTAAEVEQWAQWPGAGIALPMGGVSCLVAVDFDVEGEPLFALESALSGLLGCRKKGRKGYTAFLRVGATPWGGKCDLPSKFNITLPDAQTDRQSGGLQSTRAVDIIGYGKQTILPPSVHPAGMAYRWLSDLRLDDCMVVDLPECPLDLVERITHALAPWTTAGDHALRTRQQQVQRATEGDSFCRDLNNHALANLPLWVPELVHEKFLQSTGDGYRAVPYWRGVFDAPKVGINKTGIRDFATDQGYTPIDLTMAIKSVGLSDAIDWLSHASQMPTESVVTDAFFSALRQMAGHAVAPAAPAKPAPPAPVVPAIASEPGLIILPALNAPAVVVGTLPACVASPPGILGDIARYITASAFRPQPQLSTAAALTFCATVMGQLYRGPTRSRTNLYMLGVAESGAGKDHPFKCVTRLLNTAGLVECLGGASMASGTAVQARLAFQPNTTYLIDEIGLLLGRLNSDTAGGHEREILDVLMQAYSSADSPAFKGKDYADRNARATSVARYPCLNIFGVTTPAALYDALGSADVVSGFLNRWMLVESDELPAPIFDPADPNDIPESIIEWATCIRNPRPVEGAPLRGLTAESPIAQGYATGAVRRASHRFQLEVDARQREMKKAGNDAGAMLARLPEQVGKLAMVAAAALDPEVPSITTAAWDWAVDYGTHYNDRLIAIARDRIAGSPFESRLKRCLADLEARGHTGLTYRDMGKSARSWRALERRERDQVVDRLLETEQAIWVQRTTGGKQLVATSKLLDDQKDAA